MEILIGYILKGFVLPPGGNLFGMLCSVSLPRRWRRFRTGLFSVAFASLWICCTPWFEGLLAARLETYPAFDPGAPPEADVIVVLGGGRDTAAREYGGNDNLAGNTLVRVRYAAVLARALGLPVAVTGGAVLEENARPIAAIMREVLEQEFRIDVEWVEKSSRNTAENAFELAKILPVRRVMLVTHASHMRRAVAMFERAGFTVVPAPTGFITGTENAEPMTIFSWLPSASSLLVTRVVLHEWLGIAYYKLRYRRRPA